jgi:hypothetical protein
MNAVKDNRVAQIELCSSEIAIVVKQIAKVSLWKELWEGWWMLREGECRKGVKVEMNEAQTLMNFRVNPSSES